MIRPYQPSDKTKLIEILKLNVPKYFDPAEVKDFKGYIDDYSDTYLTVWNGDEIAGGVGYTVNKKEKAGYIRWIFFHPNSTGNGLGGEAMEQCFSILRAQVNVHKIVAETSQLSYMFFEKHKFKLIRTEKNYWGQGLDLYLMEHQM